MVENQYDFLEDKYVLIKYFINQSIKDIEGSYLRISCPPGGDGKEFVINESLKILFLYEFHDCGPYWGHYEILNFPFSFDNLTINNIYEDGSVSFNFDTENVTLNSGEEWNTSYSIIESTFKFIHPNYWVKLKLLLILRL